MDTLQAVKKRLVRDVVELHHEGVNSQSYWTAIMGLEDDEFRTFLYEFVIQAARINRFKSGDVADLLMIIACQCFTMGFILAKKEELLDEC